MRTEPVHRDHWRTKPVRFTSAAQFDDEEDKLKRKFGALDGRIHWLGRLKERRIARHHESVSSIYVICSFIEGQPRVLIEAMACGMPIIGSNVRGIRSAIEHKVTGYLCDTDADKHLGRHSHGACRNPDLMRKLGANARQHALEHYAIGTAGKA